MNRSVKAHVVVKEMELVDRIVFVATYKARWLCRAPSYTTYLHVQLLIRAL